MPTIKPAIPKGTRDFLPAQMRQRQRVLDTIRSIYEKHGFAPIETPAIENIETLMGKYGEEGDQLLFKILMRGAKAASGQCDLGLRYDLTVPLARFVAMHQNDIGRIFKRYQIQPVYRADRPGHGRFREFYQCDIDMIGAVAPLPEIALLNAVADVFAALSFDRICIHLNDRRILRALIDVSNIPVEQETTAITAIDKLDKIGVEGVLKELTERGIESDSAQKLLDNIFTTFTLLIYFMLYGIKDIADRKDIFAFLHKQVPDLKFNNGMKQRLTSFLFRYSPHFYFYIRIVLKCYTRKPNFG